MSRTKHGQPQHRIFPMMGKMGRMWVQSKAPATQDTIRLFWEEKEWVGGKTESVQT